MVRQTRNKLREAAAEPSQSRPVQSKRRRRATGAGEPEMEEGTKKAVEEPEPPPQPPQPPQPPPVGGGNLPGGSREYSPRRTRNLKPPNCLQLEAVARSLLLGRFQFLQCFLELLREKVLVLQTRRFSNKTTLSIGERSGHGERAAGAAALEDHYKSQPPLGSSFARFGDQVVTPPPPCHGVVFFLFVCFRTTAANDELVIVIGEIFGGQT